MKLDRLRQDSRLRRRVAIGLFGALLLLVTAATGVLAGVALSSSAMFSDRLAEVGDYVVAGTLLLAVVAGLVALLAYAAATGLPDLQVQIKVLDRMPTNAAILSGTVRTPWSPESPLYKGSFRDRVQTAERLYSVPPSQIISADSYYMPEIRIRNKSAFSARNPAVVIRLGAMACSTIVGSIGWNQVELLGPRDIVGVQWDGGPADSIHGQFTRLLPHLELRALWHAPILGEPTITVELFAEGYYRKVTLPVDFEVDGRSQYSKLIDKEPPEWA